MKKILIFLFLISAIASHSQPPMSLEECMSYAAENSYKSARSANDLANSKLAYTGAILDHLPSLSGSIGASANFGRGIDPATNNYISTSTFNNSISANLGLPIFNGLRLLNQTRSAKIAKMRGEEQLRQTRDQVAEETMAAYADVVYNTELVDLYARRIENYKIEEQQVLRKCALGTGSEADLAQIRATLSSEEYTYIAAQNRLEISVIKLKDCMNFPLEDSLIIEPTIKEVELFHPEQSTEEIYDYALEFHPSSIISKETLRGNKLNLSIARGSYYPSISFGAGISTSYYTRLDGIASNSGSYGEQLKNNIGEGLSVSMSVPIFNGLGTRLNVSRSKNNYAQAQRDNQETLRTLSSEIEQAAMDMEASKKQWIQAQKNVAFQKLANHANHRKYTEGLISIIEMQTSDNQLLMSEIELRNSYLSYQIKLREVNYYKGIPYIL